MVTIKKIITKYLRRITIAIVVMLLAILFVSQILGAQRQARNIAEDRFTQIEHILFENELELTIVEENLRQTYLHNAEIIAHMIDSNPEILEDDEEFRQIAKRLGLDEICVFNEEGRIFAGTNPEYNGLSFDSGEQISFFKAMLEDKSLQLCQDPMPNTYDGTMMEYSAVWNSGGTFIVQVGKNADKDMLVTEKYKLSSIFSLLQVDEDAELYAIDMESGRIVGTTNEKDDGKNVSEIGLELDKAKNDGNGFHAEINGVKSFCVFTKSEDLLLGRVISNRAIYLEVLLKAIELSMLICIAAVILILALLRIMDRLVIQNIQQLNDKLHLITEGDYEQRIELRNCEEFSELSNHLNEMVESLSDKLNNEYQYQAELTEALRMATAANKSKTSFLFSMSHDIRTPMNAILGFSAMAEKHINDKERVMDCLQKLNTAGEHLLRLINDVLDMAQIEGGKVDLNPQAHSIPESLAATKSVFSLEMEKKNIHFSVSWSVQDEIAHYDKLRMEQVELNLISNALKYTPHGGTVTYTVQQIPCEKEGFASYRGVVKDTGIGMSEDFCKHVFEPFEREHTSTVNGIPGTGLGLTITKRIIEQMGGTITCTSELGMGTEFTFVVTFKIGRVEELADGERPQTSETDFTTKRILLVEDNELNCEIACEILMDFGFNVEVAEDGLIALDKVSQSADGYYDLILMDIQMPNMDGYQATEEIRKLKNPALANIPIIALTANAFDKDQSQAFVAGMNDHLSKPIDVPKLMDTLKKYL